MLQHLLIKNVALIKQTEIEFSNNLNILSGETGAGKSMVIDSINFLVGEKTGKDFIRTGEENALVEGIFKMENQDAIAIIKNMGIEIDEDNQLLIQRTISSGRSQIRINGKVATITLLKEISKVLIDIHSQHEHHSLMNANKHIELVDKFCGKELDKGKEKLNLYIKKYKEVLKHIKELTKDGSTIGERLDFLGFQIEEISAAKLKAGEEEELTNKLNILGNSEKITNAALLAIESLSSENTMEKQGANESLGIAIRELNEISKYDDSLDELKQRLENALGVLSDCKREIQAYYEKTDHDPEELAKTEERLNLIYNLKRKYGSSVENILDYLNKIKNEYEIIINSESLLKEYNTQKRKYNKLIIDTCNDLTKIREKQASIIQEGITKELKELGMKDAEFKIDITKKNEFSINGNDKVEFLISPNKGEDLKRLSQIASGGEMSRVMLSLKTVLSKADNIETFIFDEIDQGVSGRTAQKVAEKLSFISKQQQILCVSHLPQIASMADSHFLIEKFTKDEKTNTNVTKLTYEESIDEVARLLGGAKITNTTITAAKELKDMAIHFKK